MDNLNSRKSIKVQQLIEVTGAGGLYFPRYSPELNPIEILWPVLKGFERKFKPSSLPAVDVVLKTCFRVINTAFFQNWFSKRCCIP